MSVTIDDVKDKLLTLDDVRERLSYTEPLVVHDFEVGEGVAFRLAEDYNHGLKALQPNDQINGFISIGGRELQLTQSGLYDAVKEIKLPKGFLYKAPSHIVEDILNHFFRSGLEKGEYKVLGIRGDKAAALARAAVYPYSNLRFLEILLDGIEAKYGQGEVFADYKFTHTLQQTHLRLIVPEYVRTIHNTGTDNDTWSTGIQLVNSLVGAEQTQINGYLFRYWCTNGAIDTRTSANSVWSRRGMRGRDDNAVFEWARDAVDEVLGGLESALDGVQALTDVRLDGVTRETMREMFREYGLPTPQRELITGNMLNEGDLTMYSLMQAVTQAANNSDLSPGDVNRLMTVGGDLPVAAEAGVCNSDHPCGRMLGHTH